MKRLIVNIAAILFLFPALLAGAFFLTSIGHGQSPEPSKPQPTETRRLVKPTILIIDRVGKPNSDDAILSAATANQALSNEAVWTFGAKEQHGWYLYAPLIGRMLGTEDAPASKGFALALARWQQNAGLSPTGVLDEDSLNAMVGKWQAARIKNRDVAPAEQLVTVSATELVVLTALLVMLL